MLRNGRIVSPRKSIIHKLVIVWCFVVTTQPIRSFIAFTDFFIFGCNVCGLRERNNQFYRNGFANFNKFRIPFVTAVEIAAKFMAFLLLLLLSVLSRSVCVSLASISVCHRCVCVRSPTSAREHFFARRIYLNFLAATHVLC